MIEFKKYSLTKIACYCGYITQAIAVNLLPLLFATFQREFHVSYVQIGLISVVSFVIQMAVDFIATRLGERLRYRTGCLLAHIFCFVGLVLLPVLPTVFPHPYSGIMIANVLISIGGGLTEVLISPIMNAIPEDHALGSMSLLHSFYCWGVVGVILVTTALLTLLGNGFWMILPLVWAIIPLLTGILFSLVPLPPQAPPKKDSHSLRNLIFNRFLWIFMLLMLCAGASELAISQWASLFTETGLGVSKALGDLLGPCSFAVVMGISRLLFGKFGEQISMTKALVLSGCGCLGGYLLIVMFSQPVLSLFGFGLAGFSVGILWPGILSYASVQFPNGGTSLFALLALCGDIGCAVGPGLVGIGSGIAEKCGSSAMSSLKCGLGMAIIFPLLLLLGVFLFKNIAKKEKSSLQNE